jgi:hypothetical protein
MAGGAIRGWFSGKEKLSDVDIFFQSQEALRNYNFTLIENRFKELASHKDATTWSNGETLFQCITVQFYNNINELLDSFDYTICQFAWDGKTIFSTNLATISTLRNHLGVHKLNENAVDSLRRAFKYAKKGFYPCSGSLQQIAHALRGLTVEQINNAIEISPGGGRRIRRMD